MESLPDHYIRSVEDLVPGRKYTAYLQAEASPDVLSPGAPPDPNLPPVKAVAEETALWQWEQFESSDGVAIYALRRVDNGELIPVPESELNKTLWVVEGWEASDQ